MLVQLSPLYNPVHRFSGCPPLLKLDRPASVWRRRERERIAAGQRHIFLTVWACPGVEQTSEGEWFPISHGDPHRLFPTVRDLPFI